MAKLKGLKLAAPCWYCGRKLHGGHGRLIAVDGNQVAMHHQCAECIEEDEDFKDRLETKELKHV